MILILFQTLQKENKNSIEISIIIPTINESKNLPLLLSDLSEITQEAEVLIIDSISKDKTKDIALNYGAKYFQTKERNRGLQLNFGAERANGKWLLFIHADSRLNKSWSKEVKKSIKSNADLIYYFRFKVDNNKLIFRLLEIFVNLRCLFYKNPYGDQGILISKNQYNIMGGFNKLPIMEDLDFISRIKRKDNLIQLKSIIFTNSRKWDKINIFTQSIKNWKLRREWKRGVSTKSIYKAYYNNKN